MKIVITYKKVLAILLFIGLLIGVPAAIIFSNFEANKLSKQKYNYHSIKIEQDKMWDSAGYYLNIAIKNKESVGEVGDSSFPAFKKYEMFHEKWNRLRDSSDKVFKTIY